MTKPGVLRVGQRVRLYGSWNDEPDVRTVTIVNVRAEGMLDVEGLSPESQEIMGETVHPKQVRRLVPRKRRRVWARFSKDPGRRTQIDGFSLEESECTGPGWIEFREVRK